MSIKSCKSDTFDVSTTSNIYPSSLSDFAEKTDFCHVTAKIYNLCKVYIYLHWLNFWNLYISFL